MLIFSFFIGMFPKELPKRQKTVIDAAEYEQKEFIEHKNDLNATKTEKPDLKSMFIPNTNTFYIEHC